MVVDHAYHESTTVLYYVHVQYVQCRLQTYMWDALVGCIESKKSSIVKPGHPHGSPLGEEAVCEEGKPRYRVVATHPSESLGCQQHLTRKRDRDVLTLRKYRRRD